MDAVEEDGRARGGLEFHEKEEKKKGMIGGVQLILRVYFGYLFWKHSVLYRKLFFGVRENDFVVHDFTRSAKDALSIIACVQLPKGFIVKRLHLQLQPLQMATKN